MRFAFFSAALLTFGQQAQAVELDQTWNTSVDDQVREHYMAQAMSSDWNNFYTDFPPLPELRAEIEAVDEANPKKGAKDAKKSEKTNAAAKEAADKNKQKNKAD